jgi:hypothetical protein
VDDIPVLQGLCRRGSKCWLPANGYQSSSSRRPVGYSSTKFAVPAGNSINFPARREFWNVTLAQQIARRHRRNFRSGFIVIAAALLLSGCSVSGAAPTSSANPVANRATAVTVEQGTIVPIITLQATVQTSVAYQITARTAGTMDTGTAPAVIAPSGSRSAITFSSLDRDTTLLVPPHAAVSVGLPVASATYSGFALVAPVAGANLLALRSAPESARAQVSGAGGPFECTLLDPRPSISPADGSSFLSCAIPSTQEVVSGLSGVVALRFPTVRDALILPVDAVAGARGSAQVYVSTKHGPIPTDVVVGASNGVMIEIKSGVTLGTKVIVPSPSLLDGP